jgi:ubiquinone/menaquinone biosynthesis C-methylase UbiE
MKEPDFDRVARVYRWAEYLSLGRTLERMREHFLPELTGCRSVLALGDGDGRFLARLLRQNPEMQAVAVDTSEAMLRLLRERCPAERLRVVQGSALDVEVAAGTDLVVTHFFLDCFRQDEVHGLALRLATQVERGAWWVVSDFGVPRVRWLRPFAALYVRALYLAFRVLTGLRVTRLPDPQRALTGAGFSLVARHERLVGLIYTELWQRQ